MNDFDVIDDPDFWDMVEASAVTAAKNAQTHAIPQQFQQANSYAPTENWKACLNGEQRQAVEADTQRPLLVLAGAGSGKTLTMCKRMRQILESTKCRPHEILAVTFTRNAAQEMKDRMCKEVGPSIGSHIRFATIHSFCLKICRQNAEHAGYTRDFSIYSSKEERDLIAEPLRQLDKERGVDTLSQNYAKALREKAKDCLKRIHRLKAEGKNSDSARGDIQVAFNFYEKEMLARNAMDFTDIIHKAIVILLNQKDILERYQKELRYILVDEFQDTSQLQYQLLALVAGHGCITAVGDDDQSIYSFQGAQVGNFDLFLKEFGKNEEVKVVRLQQNFRSTSTIVKASNAVIQKNTRRVDKTCWTAKGEGTTVKVVECRNKTCETAFLLDEILKSQHQGHRLSDMAILYRRNCTGKEEVIPALKRKGIPYSTNYMFKTNEISNIISFLRLATNMQDNGACRRVIRSLQMKLEQTTVSRIEEMVGQGMTMVEAVQTLEKEAERTGDGLLENLDLKQRAHQRKELQKLSNAVHVMRSRLGELSIPEFIKRVLELCPFVRQQMGQFGSNSGNNKGRSIGQAIISEAEDFLDKKASDEFEDEDFALFIASRNKEKSSEERYEEASAKMRSFLDHISMTIEEEQQLRKSKGETGPQKNKKRKPLRPGDKRLKWGRFQSDDEDYEQETERDEVWVGTVHQSKGLEWPIVFVVRMNEEEFPLSSAKGDAQTSEETLVFEEEERRLGYVALSRAKETLFLSYIVEDSPHVMAPKKSRFIRDIPAGLVQQLIKYDVATASSDHLDGSQLGEACFALTQSDWRQFVANPEKAGGRIKKHFVVPPKHGKPDVPSLAGKENRPSYHPENSSAFQLESCVDSYFGARGYSDAASNLENNDQSIPGSNTGLYAKQACTGLTTKNGNAFIQSKTCSPTSTWNINANTGISENRDAPPVLTLKEKPSLTANVKRSHLDQFLSICKAEQAIVSSGAENDDFLPRRRHSKKSKREKRNFDYL